MSQFDQFAKLTNRGIDGALPYLERQKPGDKKISVEGMIFAYNLSKGEICRNVRALKTTSKRGNYR